MQPVVGCSSLETAVAVAVVEVVAVAVAVVAVAVAVVAVVERGPRRTPETLTYPSAAFV